MWHWSEWLRNQPTEYANHLLIRVGCGLVYRSPQKIATDPIPTSSDSMIVAFQWGSQQQRSLLDHGLGNTFSRKHREALVRLGSVTCVNLKTRATSRFDMSDMICPWLSPWLLATHGSVPHGSPWFQNHWFPSSQPQEPNPPAQVRNVCRLYLRRSKSEGSMTKRSE